MTSSLQPGTKLGPYELLSPIGAGGMGEVWKARDTRLGRIVAIKKVREQHSERFKQEARTIAALNHPHICQIHDIGPDYLVLEYVEGKPLSGPLPEKEAVRLAIQVATALEAAHKKGIIHRDLKPGNIMVTDEGSVKLLDFGLAKLYEQDASGSDLPTADFPATRAGAVLGTVAYMSPEQAQGQHADARSDIFSFGLVLYEMLSGRRAFSGDNSLAILSAIQKSEPLPLQSSPSLEKIVRGCLAKQPTGRYQTMTEIRAALEQVFAEKPTVTAAEPQPSIAVLPFVNMSGDKEQEYFSDGLAEEIINALTKLPGLKVIARTSSFSFRGKDQDITKIAESLRVSTILEGSVRRSGNRIRVTAQLIAAADGSHLWSERFDREMADVFAIQDEISQAIVEKLRLRLSAGHPLREGHVDNPAAYDRCLKGRYHLRKMTQEEREAGRRYCEQAIALNPNYAPAYVVLAEYYIWNAYYGSTDPREAFSKAKSASLKALKLDEAIADAHSGLGTVLGCGEFDWEGAAREFSRALQLSPSFAVVRYDYAWWNALWFLYPLGRAEEALFEMQRALELDPLDPFYNSLVGYLLHSTGQFEPAVSRLQYALKLDPSFFFALLLLSVVYGYQGYSEEAIAAAEKANELSRRQASTMGLLGLAYGAAGRTAEARQLLDELNSRRQRAYVPASAFVSVHTGLGETEEALDWIAKGIEERDPNVVSALRSEPTYAHFRSHPRYHALLRKMNLEA